MPSDNDHMDYATLLDAQQVQKLEQLHSGIRDIANLLFIHYEGLITAGFKKSQAYDMTLQLHAVLMENTFSKIGE